MSSSSHPHFAGEEIEAPSDWVTWSQWRFKFWILRLVFYPLLHDAPTKIQGEYCKLWDQWFVVPRTRLVKILQARLQQYVNRELPDVQAGFRKGRGTSDQIANIRWIIKNAREFQKNIYCFIDYSKPLTVWITTNCGKFFKRWEY